MDKAQVLRIMFFLSTRTEANIRDIGWHLGVREDERLHQLNRELHCNFPAKTLSCDRSVWSLTAFGHQLYCVRQGGIHSRLYDGFCVCGVIPDLDLLRLYGSECLTALRDMEKQGIIKRISSTHETKLIISDIPELQSHY